MRFYEKKDVIVSVFPALERRSRSVLLFQLQRDLSVKRVDVEEGFLDIYLDGVGNHDDVFDGENP